MLVMSLGIGAVFVAVTAQRVELPLSDIRSDANSVSAENARAKHEGRARGARCKRPRIRQEHNRPDSNSAPVTTADSGFPKDDARAVATRFSVAYLNWDEANPDARPAGISMSGAPGITDASAARAAMIPVTNAALC